MEDEYTQREKSRKKIAALRMSNASTVIFDAICYQMEQEAEGKRFSLRSLNVMRLFRRRRNAPGTMGERSAG